MREGEQEGWVRASEGGRGEARVGRRSGRGEPEGRSGSEGLAVCNALQVLNTCCLTGTVTISLVTISYAVRLTSKRQSE